MPPKVEYALTKRGQSIGPLLAAMHTRAHAQVPERLRTRMCPAAAPATPGYRGAAPVQPPCSLPP